MRADSKVAGRLQSCGQTLQGSLQQLGSGLPTNVYWPTLLSDDSWAAGRPIVQAATGKAHSMFLTDQGDVYALGTNKLGQCGVKPGVASEMVGSPRLCAAPEGVGG